MTIDTTANALLTSLTGTTSFVTPTINLSDPLLSLPVSLTDRMYQDVTPLTTSDFTTKVVGGTGAFDVFMAGVSAHLKAEFDKNRITGAEYTKAYIELTQSCMQTALAFVLGKDQAFWQAQQAQIGAITARLQMEEMRLQIAKAQWDAQLAQIQFATGKAGLATAGVQYDTANFQLNTLLPAQAILVGEQANVALAQTSDTRQDGGPVNGVLSKQKALYDQQRISYQRDAEVKAAKLFTDAWTVQKTVDEGLLAPDGFTNTSLDTVLTHVKANNGLG